VNSLTSGVANDFRAAAVNATGQALWSAVITARTLRNLEWADLVVSGDGRGEIDVTRAQMLFFTLVAAVFVGAHELCHPRHSAGRPTVDGHQQRRVPHRQVHPGLTPRRCAGNRRPTSRVSTPMSSTSFAPIGSNRNVA
jgi:hypothetical protein